MVLLPARGGHFKVGRAYPGLSANLHISQRVRLGITDEHVCCHTSGNDSISYIYRHCIERNEAMRALWESCGLTPLFRVATAVHPWRDSHCIVWGVVEFFWDTTNTFHFPWGKMTNILLDFTIITGLEFRPTPLPADGMHTLVSPETA